MPSVFVELDLSKSGTRDIGLTEEYDDEGRVRVLLEVTGEDTWVALSGTATDLREFLDRLRLTLLLYEQSRKVEA